MLVLSAKVDHPEEEVLILVPPSPEVRKIRVQVVEIDRNKVRIGYTADRDIVIDRVEVHQKRWVHPDRSQDTAECIACKEIRPLIGDLCAECHAEEPKF